MESIRKIIVPVNNKLELTIPDHFTGKRMEVLASEIEEEKNIKKKKRKIFHAVRLDLSKFKFNRDEANER